MNSTTGPLTHRLERGEIVVFSQCPFRLPSEEDRQFLFEQRLAGLRHKNISFDPATGIVAGFRKRSSDQEDRLRGILAEFSGVATAWLANLVPDYTQGWRLDRATLRSEEEATRPLRQTARNDLLHIDAFPSRPSNGRRILRLFVNINPTEPRVWATSEKFAKLLARFGDEVREQPLRWRFFRNLRSRSAYDTFMLRLHDVMKLDEKFQERATRRFWSFEPGSAWLVFTDGISRAELRGRWALEHSWFVAPHALALPEEAPAAMLDRKQAPVRAQAA